jgi:hypothetical protein
MHVEGYMTYGDSPYDVSGLKAGAVQLTYSLSRSAQDAERRCFREQ